LKNKKTVVYDKKKRGRKTKLNSKSTKKNKFIYNVIIPEIMIKEALMSKNNNNNKKKTTKESL